MHNRRLTDGAIPYFFAVNIILREIFHNWSLTYDALQVNIIISWQIIHSSFDYLLLAS